MNKNHLITRKNGAICLLIAVLFVELLRTAWITDDAAITLRSVFNLINGYGATFNISERVQAYTHPLWFLLLGGLSLAINNVFIAAFLLPIVLSILTLPLLPLCIARHFWTGMLAAGILFFSKAYIDFSTSGLENPLSHLLIVLAVLSASKTIDRPSMKSAAIFFLISSSIYLTRPDLVILIFPMALLVAFKIRTPSPLIKAALIGALPVIAWTLFSLYYYGFPFPNTAYAKLGTGIPIAERVLQGLNYCLDSLTRDPLTLIFSVVACAIGFRGALLDRMLALGAILYIIHVIGMGGDFMSGRFFTAPLLTAAILLARSDLSFRPLAFIAGGAAILALVNIQTTLLSSSSYNNCSVRHGVADERGCYYHLTGLPHLYPYITEPITWQAGNKSVSHVCGTMGLIGIIKGPGAHLVDACALADPLLARLPAKYDPNWRAGHFVRQLPTDYLESIKKNENLLPDPGTHRYYESLRAITRGKLNDPARLRQIALMNLGYIEKPDMDMYRHKTLPQSSKTPVVGLMDFPLVRDSGPWNEPGTIQFESSVELELGRELNIETIDLSVTGNGAYRIEILSDGRYIPIHEIAQQPAGLALVRHTITLPTPSAKTGHARIVAVSGNPPYSVGHFRVNRPFESSLVIILN